VSARLPTMQPSTSRRVNTRRGVRGVIAVVLLLSLIAGTGCGYSLAGRGSFLPEHIRRIGVPPFANRSTVFNLETQVTEKVRTEFISRGRYTIVPDTTNVDAVLTGEISAVRPDVVAVNPDNLAGRYAVTMTARVELRDVRDNKVLWENAAMTFRQEYPAQSAAATSDPNAFFTQDASALDRMTTEFARVLVSAILEAF
jgi:hypothetical protein